MARRKKKKSRKFILCIIIIAVIAISYKGILRSFFPVEYKDMIIEYSREYEVDPNLVISIMKQESKFNSRATSNKGARGLMQIMPETGEWIANQLGIEYFNEDMLYDPETNIRMGAWYINNLTKEFNGNMDLVIAAYNGGSGNVNKWLNDERYSDNGLELKEIPFVETKKYLKNVNRNYEAYKFLYELN